MDMVTADYRALLTRLLTDTVMHTVITATAYLSGKCRVSIDVASYSLNVYLQNLTQMITSVMIPNFSEIGPTVSAPHMGEI